MSQARQAVTIEKLTWLQAREKVKNANPVLARIIDEINPSNKLYFYKANYLFGDKILKNGEMQLPCQNGTVPLLEKSVPKDVQDDLRYCPTPISLILSKSVEVFFENQTRVMPSKLINQGDMFGLWEAFDPPPNKLTKNVWNLSSGARTTFLLPKISDSIHHNKLRRSFGLEKSQPPKTLLDHHEAFAEIAKNSKSFWSCEILYFPHHWLDSKLNISLKKYFIETAWKQSFNCRVNMSYSTTWDDFTKDITNRNWNPKLSNINALKHLLLIGEGIYPGFSIANSDEHAVPVKLIQDAYTNIYELKKYSPIIMQPYHLRDKNKTAYYSLPLSTLLESAIKQRNTPRLIDELREIRSLLNVLLTHQRKNNLTYDFFHYEEKNSTEIKNSAEIPILDNDFEKILSQDPTKEFPNNSPFLRGCIKISKK